MHSETALFPNPTVAASVHNYAIQHSTPLPGIMNELREYTIKNTDAPIMMISPLQAQFMAWFARSLGVKRILEIGTFTGYSALAWAEALKGIEGAEFVALDIEPETLKVAESTFHKSESSKGIKASFIAGPAQESLAKLPTDAPFDLIFLDADKPGYLPYLHIILARNLLKPKTGVLLSDNILQRGLVADHSGAHPETKNITEERKANIEALDAFNKEVYKLAEQGLVDVAVLPMFDGLSCVRLTGK